MTNQPKLSAKIAIIVLNYNGWQDTVGCLESLQKIEYPAYLIIVVDNGSSDDSLENIRLWTNADMEVKSDSVNKPLLIVEYEKDTAEKGGIPEEEKKLQRYSADKKIVLIRNRDNLGYSAGNNVGIRYAIKKGADAVLIANPDVLFIDKNLLNYMVDTLFRENDVAAVGPKIIDMQGRLQNPLYEPTFWGEFLLPYVGIIRDKLWINKVKKLSKSNKPVEVTKLVGCCILLKTEFLQAINLLDENVFLYCEEAILAAQIRNKSKKLMYDPRCTVRHMHVGSYGDVSTFIKSRRYYLKNYKKYGSAKMVLINTTQYMIKLKHYMIKGYGLKN